jgi:hypothetical protein
MQTLKALHAFSSQEGNFAKDDEVSATDERAKFLIDGGFAAAIKEAEPAKKTETVVKK